MTDAIIVGDVHLSDKAPTSRRNTYTIEIINKIIFASTKAKELDVPLVFAGDVFHIKTPSRNSHFLVQAMHDALQGVRTFIVPGNHDMSGNRLDSLSKQPLGALCRMENVSLLLGYHPDLPGIMGIPYLPEFDIDGEEDDSEIFPWGYAIQDFWEKYAKYEPPHYRVENSEEVSHYNDLIVTHAPIFPPGQAPGVYASINPEDWAHFWSHDGPINTYYGHIHDCHGTFTTEGHTFCNQGALSRGSLHESSVSRSPAVTLWSGNQFTRIEVPHLPASEVFLFQEAERVASNKASAVEFAEALGNTKIQNLTLESVVDMLRTKTSQEVMMIIEEALETAQ